jgi:endonuclease VIII
VPEGHTLHRLAVLHTRRYGGRPVAVSSPQGRFATSAELVDGRVLESAEAHGKHLFHHYGPDLVVHVHLGLYGKLSDDRLPADQPRGQVRMRMIGESHYADLRGPTACELLDPPEVDALRARLGADPLRPDAKPDQAYERIRRSGNALAALLLDQSIVAGTGLIFVLEALFRAGLAPTAPGRTLTPEAWRELWDDLVDLMGKAVFSGRIDTVRPVHEPEAMGRPPRVDRHGGEVYVYRRPGQPCLVCGTLVSRGELAGRNSYWCATCQRGAA